MNATFEKRLQRKPVKTRLGKTLNNQPSPRADLRQKLASKKRTVDARSVLRNRRRPRALFTKSKAKVVLRKLSQRNVVRKPGGRPFVVSRKTVVNDALPTRGVARVGQRQRRPIRRYTVSRIPDLLTLPTASPSFLPTPESIALFAAPGAQPSAVNLPSTGSRLSPIQGFRLGVRNLQPSVSLDDIYELFSSVGTLRMCNLVRPGQAEVVYNELIDAEEAVRRYHNRELDGRPMNISLLTHIPNELSGSSRLASRLGPRVERSWQSAQATPKALTTSSFSDKKKQSAEIDVDVVRKALFNVSAGGGTSSRRPVDFSVSLR